MILSTSLGGIQVFYRKEGSQSSPPLILLHGWGVDSRIFRQLIKSLADRFCVYSIDLPGFGRTAPPSQDWGVFEYSSLVKHFIISEDLRGVFLLGHSFGGRIAIVLAATDPQMISKLILVDSAGFRTTSRKVKSALLTCAAKVFSILFPFRRVTRQILKPYFYKTIGNYDYLRSGTLKLIFGRVINRDLTEFVKRISMPTLIIWGEDDKETPLQFARKLNSLIPMSELFIVAQADHFPFVTRPEEFTERLRQFLLSS